jgi:hypothetical protein
MERFDIINHLIKINNYKSFLEIGTQNQINFLNVNINHKVCVDPDPESNPTFMMTSDEFFEINKDTFDIVFIDGLHHADFVYRDIINSLKFLNKDGCLVVHDCIPFNELAQIIPLEKASDMGTIAWNGDVWKSIIKLRTERKDLKISVVDTDHGCGIIYLTNNGNDNYLESYNGGYYEYEETLVRQNLNIITYDEFKTKFNKSIGILNQKNVNKVYITHCNEKYLPVAYNLAKSIREFSKIPLIIYAFNVDKSKTLIFQDISNVHVEIINFELDNTENYVLTESGNFYIDRQDSKIFKILSLKVYAMKHSLENGWDEICYLDSDCLATPIVDELFDWSNKLTNYPLGTKGIHDYMLIIDDNGESIGNPYKDVWPSLDNTKCLEWPLMDFMSIPSEKRGEYSTTGIMLLNQNCKDFIDLWWETCNILPKITDINHKAPFQEETIYNVLKWKIGNNHFPLCYINLSHGIDTVKDFYLNNYSLNALVDYDEVNVEKNFYKIPESKKDVKVLHGEKLTSECDKIILYLKKLKEDGYFEN